MFNHVANVDDSLSLLNLEEPAKVVVFDSSAKQQKSIVHMNEGEEHCSKFQKVDTKQDPDSLLEFEQFEQILKEAKVETKVSSQAIETMEHGQQTSMIVPS